MKKKKVIACILAAMTTLAIASMSAGCAVKDKFKEWFNEDSPTSSSTLLDDSEEESSTSDFPYYSGEASVFENDYAYLNPEKCTCYVGDTFRIKAEATDGSVPEFQVVANGDGIVLEVDSRGNVTALSAGTGNIAVFFADHWYLVTITVLESPTA